MIRSRVASQHDESRSAFERVIEARADFRELETTAAAGLEGGLAKTSRPKKKKDREEKIRRLLNRSKVRDGTTGVFSAHFAKLCKEIQNGI